MTGDERQPSHASRHSEHSTTSRESTSIHVQVPENVQPGEPPGTNSNFSHVKHIRETYRKEIDLK